MKKISKKYLYELIGRFDEYVVKEDIYDSKNATKVVVIINNFVLNELDHLQSYLTTANYDLVKQSLTTGCNARLGKESKQKITECLYNQVNIKEEDLY